MTIMKGFPGFPDGKMRLTQVPNLFFSDLLPIIDNMAELKVTIYAFWALSQREGQVRYLRLADFINDTEFVKGLGPTLKLASEALLDGLERAVARGTFLHINIESADGKMDLYFLNTEKGRTAVEGITRGEWRPNPDEDEPITLLVERPNVFILYEQNIGPLTPIIADELRDAEQTYPPRWLEEAIELAVENNVRKWRYILTILERWRQEGKQDGTGRRDTQKELRQPIPDEYRDIIKR
ncbi:MAG: DnaD domain protein [Chloroflexi bacterium]|nr:DnaD domain protein [Chloroflexota bacterium]MBK8935250.1 DnaD domain protein [Chloroflexota bacterium]MBP6473035.1 DnaD domain protein [Chloroflexota bacterium]MBP7041568.1 DnaD domain protein [Chloroflexota bacterium]